MSYLLWMIPCAGQGRSAYGLVSHMPLDNGGKDLSSSRVLPSVFLSRVVSPSKPLRVLG
jgi:hypothetical protein